MKNIQNFKDFLKKQCNITSKEVIISEKKDTDIVVKKPTRYKNVKDEDFIFGDGGKITGWHFPINTKARGKNALQRANQFDSSPDWYKGSLKSLVLKVVSAVKKKYPSIEISAKSSKPGKG